MASMKPTLLIFTGLTVALALPAYADFSVGQRVPAPTAAGQSVTSTPTAPFTWTPVTLPYGLNGTGQMAVGGTVDATTRLSVNPQGTAENGVSVTLPSGATGKGIVLKDSTGSTVGTISINTKGLVITPFGTSNEVSFPGATLRMDGGINPSTGGNGSPGLYPGFIGKGGGDAQKFAFAGSTPLGEYEQIYSTGPSDTPPVLSQDWYYNGIGLYAHVTSYGSLTEVPLATPTIASTATVGVSGATTYTYRVSAVSGAGETLASIESSTTTGNAALSASNYSLITYGAVTGAETYNIYGRAAGAELKIGSTVNLSFKDVGGTPSGALPAANTTGYITAPVVNATTAFQANGTPGLTVTVPLAKLTTGGTNGSLTFTGGILTASTNPT